MSNKGFTHLHLHSQYSLLDGAISFDNLLKRCKKLDMESVAVTDHGNLFGAVEFYTKALAAHIKPIIGIEAYVAPGSRFDRTKTSISDAAYHLILLAKNDVGYQNLLKLASTGYIDGFYYRPRIDKEILAELNEGLICTSACIKGEVASAIACGDEKAARSIDWGAVFEQNIIVTDESGKQRTFRRIRISLKKPTRDKDGSAKS